MLVMRTIKHPPDNVSGFDIGHYRWLSDGCDLDDDGKWVVRKSTNVQITSQVERTEPEELAVEEHCGTESRHDEDGYTEGDVTAIYAWEHTHVEGEDTGSLESEMECEDGIPDGDTDTLVTTTGHNDQEDTNAINEDREKYIDSKLDNLEIQFVKVITT